MKATSRIVAIVFVIFISVNSLFAAETLSALADANDLSFYQASTDTAAYPLTDGKKIRNVIVCIGDGMGLNQIALARIKAAGPDGKLYMERMPVTGLVRTHSASSLVTDSAAAGTALASGVKTTNGMIGMTPDETPYLTILEAAKAKGMTTGLVVTSTITHATPATFASHVRSRKTEDVIAEQLIANRVNVLLGGGRKFFLPKSDPNSGRQDDTNLLAEAAEVGYTVITSGSELSSVRRPYVLGLFQVDALTTVPPEPTLAELTSRAIQLLQSTERGLFSGGPAGFFLMVEGSQIDWACHRNDVKHTIRQTLLFDEAVQAAVDFALRDGHTLVIVTADHETGGLTLLEPAKGSAEPTVRWSTKGHSGAPVMIGALGPGAAAFTGVQDNTEIPKKIAHLLAIKSFPRPRQ
jgi:alkaline phosphatase